MSGTLTTLGAKSFILPDERIRVIQRTPPDLRQRVRGAHMTGPVPPRVEAIRNQSISALRYIAEF
eukprot:5307448-Pyramimonas_sp.AAC.1